MNDIVFMCGKVGDFVCFQFSVGIFFFVGGECVENFVYYYVVDLDFVGVYVFDGVQQDFGVFVFIDDVVGVFQDCFMLNIGIVFFGEN